LLGKLLGMGWQLPTGPRPSPRGDAGFGRFAQEDLMRKLTLWTTVWITAALVLTASVIAAGAQIQARGASGLHAQMQNATPIEKAACWGWGPYCTPGTIRRCGPYRCWCVRC
jgi:hypothetical protein